MNNLDLNNLEELQDFFLNCHTEIKIQLLLYCRSIPMDIYYKDNPGQGWDNMRKGSVVIFCNLPYTEKQNLLNQWLLQSI